MTAHALSSTANLTEGMCAVIDRAYSADAFGGLIYLDGSKFTVTDSLLPSLMRTAAPCAS